MEQGIFAGLKVLDCASFIAAPAAATVLSDFGADVIKIEPPGAGDPYRNLPNLPGYPTGEHNFAWLLEARNKKSLALDLSKPEAQAVLYKLVEQADVFITNMPPPVRSKLGITYDHLAHLNERLIYASFTGYGEKGEEANKPGFDSNAYWARSGLMDLVRADTDTTPARSVAGMGDHPCAMALYSAIVTALYQRERTGKGSHVASNLMANGVWAASVLAQAKLCGAKFGERRPRERALNAVTNHYQCKDGRWIILSLLNEERQWPTLARCMDRAELINDPRFATKPDRHARSIELIKIFDETFATRDLAEWRKILDGNGLVFGVVGILDDIPNDKQMLDNEVLVPFENDTMMTISSPIWIDGTKKVQPRKPPGVGEHSDEILRGAGYDEAAIKQLRSTGRGGLAARALRANEPVIASAAKQSRIPPRMHSLDCFAAFAMTTWNDLAMIIDSEFRRLVRCHAQLSPALLPRIRQQLQAGADADALRRELRAGLDRLRRRHHPYAGVAANGERDGRDPGARGRRREDDADRADPAQARGPVRPLRRRHGGGEVRAAALAVLGQPQAHRLHGDLPLHADVHPEW